MIKKLINRLRYKRHTSDALDILNNYDCKRYRDYSMILDVYKTQERMLGLITARQHVVEKGLTMPSPRLGFGKDNILALVDLCCIYQSKYDIAHEQFKSAIAVLKEYIEFHDNRGFELESEVKNKIESVVTLYPDVKASSQIFATSSTFFDNVEAQFPIFAKSRHTVRNYSKKDIPLDVIQSVVDLAKVAPSACNRQPARVHVCCGDYVKKVLELQNGNRGFGELANKVLVVTTSLSSYMNVKERNACYVDGGIFVMNLLYSLHYHKIGACTLNWSVEPDSDKKLRDLLGIPAEEEVICLITAGYIPDEFSMATSERINTERILKIHK